MPLSSRPRRGNGGAYLASLRKMHHQLSAVIASLNRSWLGSAPSGSFLDNIAKLLQILAIVVGAVWVLKDYTEFKKQNNQLVNQQLTLANKTAELTQSSIDLNNQLNQLKLVRSTEGRLDVTSGSSVIRSSKFDDGTFLYRFEVGLATKNVSDSKLEIPAVVNEVFLGTLQADNVQIGKVSILDLPYSWLQHGVPTNIKWTRLAAYTQSNPQVEDSIAKLIADFPSTSGGLPGEIDPGESHDWNAEFILRAHNTDLVASVITFWTTDESNQTRVFTYTRSELLSEAQNSSAAQGEPANSSLKSGVQHTESSSPGVTPNPGQ